MIEWSLEARLGRGWLTEDPPDPVGSEHASTCAAPVPVRRNLVIRAEPDGSAWNAFVVEEPRILTFGSSLAEVQARAADAARVWYAGAPVVDLVPHLQLDPATCRWVSEANGPGCSAERRSEARRHLDARGLSDQDVEDLLRWPHPLSARTDAR